eukprot:TRINITY_DN9264_c0_g1_i1.p1 TRINITY_DN9264_c0_g1~~TRINITY_DN9264_c0_g1_i1.p1  ORF type:complete len:392 (+),score=79.84 TRINITY_DN9264_c0_g1_i1:65-1240(+)
MCIRDRSTECLDKAEGEEDFPPFEDYLPELTSLLKRLLSKTRWRISLLLLEKFLTVAKLFSPDIIRSTYVSALIEALGPHPQPILAAIVRNLAHVAANGGSTMSRSHILSTMQAMRNDASYKKRLIFVEFGLQSLVLYSRAFLRESDLLKDLIIMSEDPTSEVKLPIARGLRQIAICVLSDDRQNQERLDFALVILRKDRSRYVAEAAHLGMAQPLRADEREQREKLDEVLIRSEEELRLTEEREAEEESKKDDFNAGSDFNIDNYLSNYRPTIKKPSGKEFSRPSIKRHSVRLNGPPEPTKKSEVSLSAPNSFGSAADKPRPPKTMATFPTMIEKPALKPTSRTEDERPPSKSVGTSNTVRKDTKKVTPPVATIPPKKAKDDWSKPETRK